MSDNRPNKSQIFNSAAERKDPAERAVYLNEACGDDRQLRAEIEELLKHDEQANSFLNAPPAGLAATLDACPIAEGPGTQIGRYKLLQQIGEGGMGVVFMAEQREPVRRKVALKIIKQGMDTQQVIARFEAERQALAMMDHPNIAKVLDAGATESGRPYFVMELVNGISVTKFCDEQHLTTKERLELFIPICQAVQHAHQKGIIHRDLKPSNILVALYDDRAVPKIIDFGVVKATSQTLTEKTMFTQLGQLVGTLEYMSPEQAQRNQLDIDTRSDIYSLGVLLYELLTGDTPFDRLRLRSAAFGEMLRIITQEEPPKPSTKISTLGVNATAISKSRNTNPDGLFRSIRGDLDWIVMKSLEKERGRRYESAGSFATDIRRLLNGEAIEARPPSAFYRMQKTVTRHRVAFTTTAMVMAALLIGMVASLWFAHAARDAERQMQMTMRTLHDQLIERIILKEQLGDREGVAAAMKLAKESNVPDTTLKMLEGIARYYDGDNASAIRILENVVKLEPKNVTARAMLALSYGHYGAWSRYLREILQAQEEATALNLKDYESLVLGCALMYLDTERSIKMLKEMVERHPEWIVARAMLGGARGHRAEELDDHVLAEQALQETKRASELLPENRVVALYNVWTHRLAIYFAQKKNEDYKEIRKETEASIQLLMKARADYTVGAYNLAAFYEVIGEDDKAIKVFSESIGHADRDLWTNYYVALLVRCGRFNDAIKLLDTTIKVDSIGARFTKAILLAFLPERRNEAKQLLDSSRHDPDFAYCGTGAVEVLCVLHERAKVRSESQKILELLRKHDLSAWIKNEMMTWMSVKSLEFHAGMYTIDQFNDVCGPKPIGQTEFHYQVAMRKLSEGDREGALHHFDECAKLNVTDNWYCEWAKAFRRLLQDNPNWPVANLWVEKGESH